MTLNVLCWLVIFSVSLKRLMQDQPHHCCAVFLFTPKSSKRKFECCSWILINFFYECAFAVHNLSSKLEIVILGSINFSDHNVPIFVDNWVCASGCRNELKTFHISWEMSFRVFWTTLFGSFPVDFSTDLVAISTIGLVTLSLVVANAP